MSIQTYVMLLNTKLLPLIYAIVGFGLLIMIHEFGHFLFCKFFGIYTPTFSIGIGPKILEKKIGSTNFRLSALPIGGYVEIAGLSEVGQGEQSYANMEGENSFETKPYWQKACVILGGITFNLIFAYLIYSILFFIGVPKNKAEIFLSSNISKEISEKFDLKTGDKIVCIDEVKLSAVPKMLMSELGEKLIKPLTEQDNVSLNLKIERENNIIDVLVTSANKEFSEKILSSLEIKSAQIPGEYEKYPFLAAIVQGVQVTNQWIYQIFYSFKYLITQKTLKGAGGPIMILSKTFETAQKGIIPLLMFIAFISINLAILNLLPIGALDGGQFLFITIEAIIRREIPYLIKFSINLASWALILSLILYLSYKDIFYLITGKY